ncbi:unnamed protein product [Allacma fusca]|uniref:CLIP domain-containing serine protease n=1 Tax=Allacma fusca TaxID=39272 RepID=A0A8J2JPV4_9HEXA|nr:unnamed protein product [Allacma fusca]
MKNQKNGWAWISPSLTAISFLISVAISIGHCLATGRQCTTLNNGTGSCVPLKNCPVLVQMLSSPNVTLDTIRQLQKLTCGFDRDEPRACCPTNQVQGVKPDLTNKFNTLIPLENHKNWKLLPKFDECGKINTTVGNRIIGGTVPPHGSQPWLARIGYSDERGDIGFYCGGSLISRRYVLTAAHCVVGEDSNQLAAVRLGEYDTESNPDCSPETGKCSYIKDADIEKVIAHPNYSPNIKQNDIALIRLSEDVPIHSAFIKPVCLPGQKDLKPEFDRIGTDEDAKTDYGIVAGWGSLKWNVIKQTALVRYVYLPVVTNAQCQNIYDGRTNISSSQMCAGGEAGKDSCDGDSGGPLIKFLDNLNLYFQIGIVSYGPTRCGSGGLPGIYTRITEYMDWILNTMEP